MRLMAAGMLLWAAMMASPLKLLERLPSQWAGLVVMGLVAAASSGGTLWAVELFGLGERLVFVEEASGVNRGRPNHLRLDSLEQWRDAHVAGVTQTGMEQVRSLRQAQDSLFAQMGRMRLALERHSQALGCLYYNVPPPQCPVAPPVPTR